MTLQPRNGRRSPKLPTRSRNDQKSEIFPLQTSGVLRDLDANANKLRGVRVPVVSLDQKEFQKDDINSPSDRKKDGTNIKQKKPKIYYKTSWEREVVKEALKAAGMVRAKKKKTLAHLYWTKHLSRKQIAALKEGQMTNHFPESWCIGRKDRLITCFEKAGKQNRKGMYDEFLPKSFLLPRDFDKYKKAARSRKNMFIMKPVASSCGRGIKLISKKDKIDRQKKCVIQEYIKSPYLIGLKKFDLRLYCLVSSFDPLRAYLYREGIVRFASKPYSPKTKASKYSYLTNFSVNQKILPNETEDHKYDEIKWTLSRFWEYIVDTESREKQEKCEKQIKDIMIKTLIAADAEITPALRSSTRSRRCCFELFGFDILLDSALKPWILEVNISPSLGVSQHHFYLFIYKTSINLHYTYTYSVALSNFVYTFYRSRQMSTSR